MTTPVVPSASPAPPRPPRPATAAVAVWLQAAVVLLCLVLIGAAWYDHVRWLDLIDEAARLEPGTVPAVAAAERQSNLIGAVVATVLLGLAALWFGGTLPGLWRGVNAARVVSLVGGGLIGFGGVVLGCCGVFSGMFLVAFLFSLPMEPGPMDPAAPGGPSGWEDYPVDPFQDRLYELSQRHPAWTDFAVPVLGLLAVALLLTIFALLLVPPSNRWYSPRPLPAGPFPGYPYAHLPQAYPAHPYPAYPAQPYQPYPAYPAQPHAAQPYPGQPYPGQPYPGQPYPGHGYPAHPQPGHGIPGQDPSGPSDPGPVAPAAPPTEPGGPPVSS